jgi:cell division protein FtsZ
MLAIPRQPLSQSSDASRPPRILIVGIGNAGVNLADRLTMGSVGSASILAANTDSQSLATSIVSQKLLIGSRTARGLGTGGDPELGAGSAEESQAEIDIALDEAELVILCGGLGGGAASGAMPVIAEIARNKNALVLALCTLPFSFEGKRRSQQAAQSIRDLQKQAHAMIFFENDRMSEISEPLAGLHDTFAASDQILLDCVYSILRIALSNGPIRVTTSDLLAIFNERPPACLFGVGQAEGSNRAHEAVERALKNPLIDRGRMLAEARSVLVHIEGPHDLSLAEVQAVMQTVSRHTEDEASLHLGISTTSAGSKTVTLSLLCAVADRTSRPTAPSRSRPPLSRAAEQRTSEPAILPEPAPIATLRDAPDESLAPAETNGSSRHAEELFNTAPFTSTKNGKKPRAKQETLQLDPVARGRFEKSEPTIVGGEDLDVPTFLRLKVKLK